MIDFDVGVSAASTYVVKKIDSDYFEESCRLQPLRSFPRSAIVPVTLPTGRRSAPVAGHPTSLLTFPEAL
jgi:hypothetical protein